LDAANDILREVDAGGRTSEAVATASEELQRIHKATLTELQNCTSSLPEADRQPFVHLYSELDIYWKMVEPGLNPGGTQRTLGEPAASTAAQHAAVLALTRDISALNESELHQGERQIGEVFATFRSRLELFTLAALALGLLLAVITIGYTSKLEKKAEERYRESRQAHRELKELSKQLVDAQEKERRAIARELHDEIGQSLSALLMEVEMLAARPENKDDFERAVNSVRSLALTCVEEVRNMSLLLRPSMLDDLGLIPALEWQAREVSKRTGMIVDVVDKNVSEQLPEEYKTCVYRVVQEALNNATKHAQAKRVKVTIEQDAERLGVTVDDDGRGFNVARTRGMGLVGMNERVARLDGVLKVDSEPGRGTRVQVVLPVSVAVTANTEEAPA
jgi:signal transduction histidine kinase